MNKNFKSQNFEH